MSVIAKRLKRQYAGPFQTADATVTPLASHLVESVRTPLLMVVSARKGVDDKVAAFQAGADDYLVKPVDPATFLTEVKRLSYFAQALLPG